MRGDAGRTEIQRAIEELQPACAVLDARYFNWRVRPENEAEYGLHARRYGVVSQLGIERARHAAGIFDTTHYSYAGKTDAYKNLPELLIGYLEAYERLYGAV